MSDERNTAIIEAIQESNRELREDVKELTKATTKMSSSLADYFHTSKHLGERSDKQDETLKDHSDRIRELELIGAGNKTRWKTIGVIATGIISLSIGIVLMVSKIWIQNTTGTRMSNEVVIELLKEIQKDGGK